MTTSQSILRRFVYYLNERSIPLLLGIVTALLLANINYNWYATFIHEPIIAGELYSHKITLHFIVNDVLMVFFFGLAAKEIVSSLRPGGSLYPPSRALNPIVASIGGIVFPAVVYLSLIHGLFYDVAQHDILMGAWAVPTATDIALVWVTARCVFGVTHPAVNFLLLLAIMDDFIGIIIIALIYTKANVHMTAESFVYLSIGLSLALTFRWCAIQSWACYVFFAGTFIWLGLLQSPIHPALALIPIVLLLPQKRNDAESVDASANFERAVKPNVEMNLFWFGFVNAGVTFGQTSFVTWVVLASLVIGKTVGITCASLLADRWCGWSLPEGMTKRHVVIVGLLASIGLTVALFVTGQAFPVDSPYQAAARMGALMSIGVAFIAVVWVKIARWH